MWKQQGPDASTLSSLVPRGRDSSVVKSLAHSRPLDVSGQSRTESEDDNTISTAEHMVGMVDDSKHEIYNISDDDFSHDSDDEYHKPTVTDGAIHGTTGVSVEHQHGMANGTANNMAGAAADPLGQDKLHLDTFVGREDELERLNSIYGRICRKSLTRSARSAQSTNDGGSSNKDAQIVFIHGYSGSGKSALVDRFLSRLRVKVNKDRSSLNDESMHSKEEQADAAMGRGNANIPGIKRKADSHPCYFGKGKYDQYSTGGNLSAIVDALSHFFQQILAHADDAECERIRRKISSRMDSSRQGMVCRVIPGLSMLLMEQKLGKAGERTGDDASGAARTQTVQNSQSDTPFAEGDAHSARRPIDDESACARSCATIDPLRDEDKGSIGPKAREWAQLVYGIKATLKAICTDDRPLVLYLDDLQWIDERSLKLITEILLDPSIRNLLIIGSYRSNEVHSDPKHQLTTAVSQWKNNGKTIHDIPLDDLTVTQTADLLASSLRLDAIKTAPLAKLLHDKTKGNVLYTMQALEGLRRRKVLTRNIHTLQWEWDGQRAADEIDMAANVVDLITSKLHSLPQDLQKCLQMASFLRSTFCQSVLETLMGREIEEQQQQRAGGESTRRNLSLAEMSVGDALNLAVKEELLERIHVDATTKQRMVGSGESFRFVHDRIQQAAFSLSVPGDEVDQIKYRIGKHLIDIASDPILGEDWMWFVAAGHLENVSSLAVSENIIPAIDLVNLNLKVGQLAIAVAAFVPAAKYLNLALTNLETKIPDRWKDQHDLSIEVYRSLSEVELTLGNYDKGSMLCQTVIDNSGASIEGVIRVNSSLVMALCRLERSREAMNLDLRSLKMLGTFPMRNHLFLALRDFGKIKKYFAKHTDDEVLDLPIMTDPKIKMTMKILFFFIDVAYHAGCKGTMMLAMVRQTRLMLKYGLCAEGAYSLAAVGSIAVSVFKHPELSRRLCALSRRIMDRTVCKSVLCMFYSTLTHFVTAWTESVHVCLDQYRQGQQAGMESGNIEVAYRCWAGSLMQAQLCGLPLSQLQKTGKTCIAQLKHYGLQATFDTFSPWQDMAETLMGIPSTVATYPDKGWKESFDIIPLKDIKLWNYVSWSYFYCSRIMLATYFGDLEAGCGYIEPLYCVTKGNNAFIVVSVRLFCSGLALSRLAQRTPNKRKRRKYSRQSQQYSNMLKSTIEIRGSNNLHRYMIMQADLMAASGKGSEDEVKAAYDKAISFCARSGYIHETALANELAAEYFLNKQAPADAKRKSQVDHSDSAKKEAIGTTKSSTFESTSLMDDDTGFYWSRHYLGNAISLYNEWGARAKVEQLLEKHPNFLDRSMLEGGVDGDNGKGSERRRKRRTARHTADTRMCVATAHKIMAEVNFDAL